MVVIGRNEGARLRLSLASAVREAAPVVYVDSGSADGSVALARSLGVAVVELDPDLPFTAGRARNAGFDYLLARYPHLELVQFLDGDCALAEGWLARARQELHRRADVAIVCGRRRELQPGASIYNRLCDIEWDTPVGTVKACGGDALVRVSAFKQVGGFDPGLIAGEEPDLCLRLRQTAHPSAPDRGGWTILRIDAEMTRHDAAMRHFSQWWKRSMRAGHAYAEGAWRHGRSPERHWVRESLSILAWAAAAPLLSLGLVRATAGLSLAGLAAYPLLFIRIFLAHRRRLAPRHVALYAGACVLGKFPQLVGMLMFLHGRLTGRRWRIEYKQARHA